MSTPQNAGSVIMRGGSWEQPSLAPRPSAPAAAAPATAAIRRLPSGGCCQPLRQFSLDRTGSASTSAGAQGVSLQQPSPAHSGASRASSGAGAAGGSSRSVPSACLLPDRWAKQHVRISWHKRPGFMCCLSAEARLPLPATTLFELLTHPGADTVLCSLGRCTRRRVLWEDGPRLVAEVEQETTCQFLWFSGRVSTPLRVEQDAAARTVTFRLAPARCQDDSGCGPLSGPDCSSEALDAGTQAACGHLTAMEGSWTVTPVSHSSSLLRVQQAVQPRGLPPLLAPAMGRFMAGQVKRNFEDLCLEALRIRAGKPTLPLPSLLARRLSCSAPLPAAATGPAGSATQDGAPQCAGPAGGSDLVQPALRPLRLPPMSGQPAGPRAAAHKRHGKTAVADVGSAGSSGSSSGCGNMSICASASSCEVASPFAAWSQRGFDGRQPAGLVAASAAGWPASHQLSLLSLLSSASSNWCNITRGTGGGFAGGDAGLCADRTAKSFSLTLDRALTTAAACTQPGSRTTGSASPSPWLLPAAAVLWLLVLAVQLLAATALR